ncbi:unnamed protein product [Pleuronectes platessa]|uniref:Uncharacterized protein n=1 Tax=Pleuronectes platessa TaxID=8262 RepID=A0A9N7UCT9_PLEPL|nr:unnamed protein product [Pleuronectes platessa]
MAGGRGWRDSSAHPPSLLPRDLAPLYRPDTAESAAPWRAPVMCSDSEWRYLHLHIKAVSGNASRTCVAVLMLPLPTCSPRALQRKASHCHRARTSMIYEPSVASDVPVA